jgi:hypothetical protein
MQYACGDNSHYLLTSKFGVLQRTHAEFFSPYHKGLLHFCPSSPFPSFKFFLLFFATALVSFSQCPIVEK